MMKFDLKSTLLAYLRRSRRLQPAIYTVLALAMIFSFQNCGGNFDADSGSTGTSSSSGTTNGATGASSNTVDPAVAQRLISDCKAIQGRPTLTSLTDATTIAPVSTVNLNSATSTLSGDTNNNAAQNIKLSFNSAISDLAKNNSLGCNIQPRFSCSLVTDGSKPLAFSRAIDINGTQIGVGANATTLATIATNAFSRNDCSSMNNLQADYKTFKIATNQNNQNRLYCVQGEATIRITMSTRFSVVVNGNAQNFDSATSDPIFLKVTVTDRCWTESRLLASSVFPGASEAGRMTAIDGKWAAVVAPYETLTSPTNVHKAGAAYMFEKVSGVWTYRQKIVLPNVAAVDTISSAAISGSRLALGTEFRASERGSVFIYKLDAGTNQWVNMQEIQPTVTGSPQRFGAAIAMTASTLVVGSPKNSTANTDAGRVYVFDCPGDTCSSTPRLTYTGSVLGAGLGSSLSISGGLVAMGAPGTEYYLDDTADGFTNGYVAVRDLAGTGNINVNYTGSVTINDTNSVKSRFGSSVVLSGSRLAIGAKSRNGSTTMNGVATVLKESGAFYYYSNYATTSTPRMVAGNVDLGNLGAALAMTANGLIVGCPACAGGKTQAESAGYVNYYSFTTLDGTGTIGAGNQLFALDENKSAIFGNSISVSGNDIMIGASGRNNPNDNGGAAYVYEMR